MTAVHRRHVLVALLLLALAAPMGCETVPYTGRRQIQLVSATEEAQMGVQSFQQIVGKATLSTDAQANALVQRVGSRIAAVTDLGYQWEFRVIQDDKQVNAFALPGGQVFITEGLFRRLQNEAQVAGVLGHEVGHVVARHSAEHIAKAQLTQGLTGAAVIANHVNIVRTVHSHAVRAALETQRPRDPKLFSGRTELQREGLSLVLIFTDRARFIGRHQDVSGRIKCESAANGMIRIRWRSHLRPKQSAGWIVFSDE